MLHTYKLQCQWAYIRTFKMKKEKKVYAQGIPFSFDPVWSIFKFGFGSIPGLNVVYRRIPLYSTYIWILRSTSQKSIFKCSSTLFSGLNFVDAKTKLCLYIFFTLKLVLLEQWTWIWRWRYTKLGQELTSWIPKKRRCYHICHRWLRFCSWLCT